MGGEGAAQKGDGGSILRKWGPLAAMVLLAQSVVAFAIIWFVFRDNVTARQERQLLPAEELAQKAGLEEEPDALPFIYASDELKNITANPAGTNAERFVMFSIKLGLVAREHRDSPRDVTRGLARNTAALERIRAYDSLIKSRIVRIVRLQTVEQLDGRNLENVQEKIRHEVNQTVLERLFPIPDDSNNLEIRVQDVMFSDIIIQ